MSSVVSLQSFRSNSPKHTNCFDVSDMRAKTCNNTQTIPEILKFTRSQTRLSSMAANSVLAANKLSVIVLYV
jgi:hypothetical protein